METKTINKTDLITEREMLPDDKNLILATMLRGLYFGKSVFSDMKKQTFMTKYHDIVNALVMNSKVKVSCLKEDESAVLGYVIMSKDETVLHWMFCKKPWRNIGVIRDLLPSTISKVTHLSRVGLSISKQKNWEFDPFLT